MHFTPFGQMEIAAPTGLISFTASNTSQVIPAFFRATAALRPPIPAPITNAFMLFSLYCVIGEVSNLRTSLLKALKSALRRQHGEVLHLSGASEGGNCHFLN